MDFIFLTQDQILSYNFMDCFGFKGGKCAVTDYAILLGAYVSDVHTRGSSSLKDRTGIWWTSTLESSFVYFVTPSGKLQLFHPGTKSVGSRPALKYSSVSDIFPDDVVYRADGRKEVVFGEYPQTVVDKKYSSVLEKAYKLDEMTTTGKKYHADVFCEKIFKEYEYAGNKYIRLVPDSNCNDHVLSDGRKIVPGKPYWVRVEPIVWLLNENDDILLSDKILFSGVPFYPMDCYYGNFQNTTIKKYMDQIFSKDIMPNSYQLCDVNKELSNEEAIKLLKMLRRNLKSNNIDTLEIKYKNKVYTLNNKY